MLSLRPMTVTDAKAFVARHHRHNAPPESGLFAVGVEDDAGEPRGVAIVGRPVARALQDGWTCEVTRVGTDGVKNGCSMLYGAACRAAKALGYRRAYTYTLAEESGASLKASGWTLDAELPARPTWDTPARRRMQTDLFGEDRRPPGRKRRWVKILVGSVPAMPGKGPMVTGEGGKAIVTGAAKEKEGGE
jgi:hypothetical protein